VTCDAMFCTENIKGKIVSVLILNERQAMEKYWEVEV
jgi:hypothetical protein